MVERIADEESTAAELLRGLLEADIAKDGDVLCKELFDDLLGLAYVVYCLGQGADEKLLERMRWELESVAAQGRKVVGVWERIHGSIRR